MFRLNVGLVVFGLKKGSGIVFYVTSELSLTCMQVLCCGDFNLFYYFRS